MTSVALSDMNLSRVSGSGPESNFPAKRVVSVSPAQDMVSQYNVTCSEALPKPSFRRGL